MSPATNKQWISTSVILFLLCLTLYATGAEKLPPSDSRPPSNDTEMRYWLENMVWYHHFSDAEMAAATGLTDEEISRKLREYQISPATKPQRNDDAPLLTLPYPGGRHPRIGFLEGAIRPQRETKVSVFTPWDENSYVVVDVPEAIWSNLGLTYLAHTHIPTVWDQQNINLAPMEWERLPDGTLQITRKLPNGIVFGAKIMPEKQGVKMKLWLENGSPEKLTDLRVQNCVMLKSAQGFADQTNDNKVLTKPFSAARSRSGDRWVITAWDHCHRPWANERCPCLHSDPKFPDCAPGEKKTLHGWVSFYEGKDIQAEFARLKKLGWLRDEN